MSRFCVTALLIIAVGLLPTIASAQDCIIGPYVDAVGTSSLYYPSSSAPYQLSVFIVMFTEDVAAAAAYKMDFKGLDDFVFLQQRIAGPGGAGLILDESPSSIGTNIALAECVVGFGGLPILVEEYVFVVTGEIGGVFATISANANQNPQLPEYVTCTDVQKDCMQIGRAHV